MYTLHERERIRKYNPVFLIGSSFLSLYLLLGFIIRIVLMLTSPAGVAYSFIEVLRIFGVGIISDLGMGLLFCAPLIIVQLGLNEWKYRRPQAFVILFLFLAAVCYVYFTHSIFHEYGGVVPKLAKIFFTYKFVSYALRYFFPQIRSIWRACTLYFLWALYFFVVLLVGAGEYFFWEEFGVRYNFIAVDYLVYTNEVVGNIMESYAMVPLLTGISIFTIVLIWVIARKKPFKLNAIYTFPKLISHVVTTAVFAFAGIGLLRFVDNIPTDNQYVTQLQGNGSYDFVKAFRSNMLEYDQFYPLVSESVARQKYKELSGFDESGTRIIGDSISPEKYNIVLVTVESLSASFLKQYGDTLDLTPNLNKLMSESLVFDSLFACGNRTVRGLEALTLCTPPVAGESIIKREANKMGDRSLGHFLNSQGYRPLFFYCGDAYFDNLREYYSNNEFEVIDRKKMTSGEITFENIWGVCDEDIYRKAIGIFDRQHQSGKPFFAQIMTTSNHRPFTYPEGRIKLRFPAKSREGGVKYTDYAIGRLLEEARRKTWFDNTIFVFIADHCASSAGKTSLPIDNYHIPCLIYSPKNIHPEHINKVCSQIDVMPTLFSMMHLRGKVYFSGHDILNENYRPRAFMATYQDMGYYENHVLTVLSPVRKVTQYAVTPNHDGTFLETPVKKTNQDLLLRAQSYYQYVNMYVQPEK